MKKAYTIFATFLFLSLFYTSTNAQITTTLKPGDTNQEVTLVQKILNGIGKIIAPTGPGSKGNETSFYGSLTASAIKALQCEKGIVCEGTPETTGWGTVGPKTRNLLNQLGSSLTNFFSSITPRSQLAGGAGVPDLIAHYEFENNALDSAGSNNGTVNGGATYAGGRIGQAISLDGADDNVALNTSVIGANDLTVCSWFYAKSPSPNRFTSIIHNNMFILGVDTFYDSVERFTDTFRISNNYDVNQANSDSFTPNKWHHMCTTRSGSTMNIYIDGTRSGAADQNGGTPASGGQAIIGQGGFYGYIDEVRIYSRALSSSEVIAIYNDDLSNPQNDTLPPVFSNVKKAGTDTTATITWDTDEAANSQIEYGLTAAYGSQTTLDATMTQTHTQTITSLTPQTTYHYRVKSKDSAGNLGVDIDRTFTTGAAYGTTIEAASCSRNDVKTAIDNAPDGGIVVVPPGNCTWTEQIVVDLISPQPRSLIIKSKNGCTLDAKGIPTSCSTTLNNGMTVWGWPGMLMRVYTAAGRDFRLTGFAFGGSNAADLLNIGGDSKSVRIDHNYFDNKNRGMFLTGYLFGVIDHNYFSPNIGQAIMLWHETWGGHSWGDGSWAAPLSMGSEQAIYIENNKVRSGIITDAFAGARFVVRYNDIAESKNNPIHNHGLDSGGRFRGTMSMESYGNTITLPAYITSISYMRSATQVLFNNTVYTTVTNEPWYNNNVHIASLASYRNITAPAPFRTCDGSGKYDKNDLTDGSNTPGGAGDGVFESGTHTGAPIIETFSAGNPSVYAVLTSSGKTWGTNQWVGYSLINKTRNWGGQIKSNTSNTITPETTANPGEYIHDWMPGDVFEVRRADICLDQVGRGQGGLLSGGGAAGVYNDVSPLGWPNQASEPVYTWNNTVNGVSNNKMSNTNANGYYNIQKNRDYFEGMCRPGYTPYTYPHPLVLAQDGGSPQPVQLNCPGSTPIPTVGACSTVVNQCAAGNFVDVADTLTHSLWSCVGAGGTAQCNQPTTPPVTTPDTTPPSITLTTPPNNSSVSGSVLLTSSSSDNTGVVGVTYNLDNTPLYTELTSSPYSGTWDVSGMLNGTYTLSATARDAAGNRATSTPVTVTVSNPVNTAPVLGSIGNRSIAEASTLTFTVSATDSNPLTYSASSLPSGATFTNGVFSWTPTYTQAGTYTVTFTASDGTLTDTETITITVTNTNRVPTVSISSGQETRDAVQLEAIGADPDNDTLTYAWTKVSGTGNVIFTPSNTEAEVAANLPQPSTGNYTFRVTVSDGKGGTAFADYTAFDPSPDADQDGILDPSDKCPGTITGDRPINRAGCPTPKITLFTVSPSTIIDTNSSIDLKALSTLELSNTFGKVKWGTTGSTYPLVRAGTYGKMDIDANLTITRGSIGLNSTNLPELNRQATLTFNNLTITNPAILKDGALCTNCLVQSYVNNTLVVSVPGFSTYTIIEDTTPTPPTGGGGGTSGGGTTNRLGGRRGIFTPTIAIATIDPGCTAGAAFSTVTGKRCTTTASSSTFKFTKTLQFGMIDPEVKELQKYLNNNGFPVALTGVGSKGYENTRFGPATRAALIKFQIAKGIKPSIGFFGPVTRGYVLTH